MLEKYQNIGRTQKSMKTEEVVAKMILETCQKNGFTTKEQAKQMVQGVLEKLDGGSNEEKLANAEMENLADIINEPMEKMEFSGLSSGFKEFDRFSMGFKPGEVIVMGGYPHKGKSTLMMRWCFEFVKQGADVAYFPFDDDRRYFKSRAQMMANGEKIDLNTCEGKIGMFPKEFQPFFEEDKKNLVVAIRILKRANPNLKVVVIDMLNSILDTVKDKDANSFTSTLQTVAEEVGICLFLICRLREASGLTQKVRDRQAINPDINSIYGDSRTAYVASKVITLSGTFNYSKQAMRGMSQMERQYIGLHIAKCRGGFVTNENGEDGQDEEIIYELCRTRDSIRVNEIGTEIIKTEDAK